MAVPYSISSDYELNSIHNDIISIRSKIHNNIAKQRTGAYSSKDNTISYISKLFSVLKKMRKAIEGYVIPIDKIQDFDNGLISIVDYIADYDLLQYYSNTYKIETHTNILLVQLRILSSYNTVSLVSGSSRQDGVYDVVDDNEFIKQGAYNPVSEIVQSYIFHKIKPGETFRSISNKYYQDADRSKEIIAVNNINSSDFIEGMIGEVIKVPVPKNIIIRNGDARVYEPYPSSTDVKSIEKYLYGTDIKLVNGKFQFTGSRLQKISGPDVVRQNVYYRLKAKKVGLNPGSPRWGLGSFKGDSGVPFLIKLERYLMRAESQGISDPRVVDSFVKRDKIKLFGETIRSEMELSLIGGEKVTLEV